MIISLSPLFYNNTLAAEAERKSDKCQYIQIETLDRSTVVELIEKITVSEQYFIDGERFQDVRVKYKFIGEIPTDPTESNTTETHKKQSA